MTLLSRTRARRSTGSRRRLALLGATVSLLATGITTTVTTDVAHAASWVQITGSLNAREIGVGVGTSSAVWAIDWNDQVYRRNGSGWDAAFQTGVRLSVDSAGKAWVVKSDGSIWVFDIFGQLWSNWPGSARDIAHGGDGSIWATGTDGAVYRWNGAQWEWRGGALADRIDVDSAGNAYVRQTNGTVFKNSGTTSWINQGVSAQDVGAGQASTAIWRTANISPNGQIYRRSGTSGTNWIDEGRTGRSIDVDKNGKAWITQINGSIWKSV